MAICHLRTSVGSASRGQSATAKVDYITREGKYGRDAGEVEHVEHGNMPAWAAEDGRGYWQAADAGERANGRLFVEVQFALPNELDSSQQRELARAFARQLTAGERLPYTVAVHRGESKEKDKPDNPHAHIVLSERSNDGVARTGETWFRRANRQQPERGGARKVSQLQAREWPERIRQGWSKECNRALERAGRGERIDPRTLAEQARAALKKGDPDQAAELARTPEPKRGAGDAIQRRYERGKAPEPSRAVAAWKRVRAANEKWQKECRQRSQKVSWERAALDTASRQVPMSQGERVLAQFVGREIGKRMAQAGRSGERPEPPEKKPQTEPSRWQRYQQRREQRRSDASRKQFAKGAAGRVIKQLEKGAAPWQQGWKSPQGAKEPPYNPTTGARYDGLNAIVLRSAARERGYSDPRWLTYNQAKKVGVQVRKGEQGTKLEYWRFRPKEESNSKDAPAVGGPEKSEAIHRTYTVFNAQQCDRIPSLARKWGQDWEVSERAARLLQASGADIEHRRGDQAYYQPKEDKIVLSEPERFRTPADYYATALHELGHWSGHKNRLDRETLHQGIKEGSGSDAYAKEELRAEMTSMTVNGVMRLPHNPERHASYVDSWIKMLKKDPEELRRAASDAGAAVKHLLQYDRERPREKEPKSFEAGLPSTRERTREPVREPKQGHDQADNLMSR